MMKCPIKGSKEWKTLINQLNDNEDAAWATWVYHGYDYPATFMNRSKLNGILGVRNNMSGYALGKLRRRVAIYNKDNKTGHTIEDNRLGMSDTYNPTIVINYMATEKTKQTIHNDMSIMGKSVAKNILKNEEYNPNKVYILGANQYEKGGTIYSTYGDALNNNEDLLPDSIKPGVQEVFESNPELANAVYEAVGFNIQDNNIKDLTFELIDSDNQHDYFKIFYKGKDLTTDGKVTTGEITLSLHNQGYIDAIEIPTELRNKGLGKSIYRKVNLELLNGELKSDSLGRISENAKRVWESLVKSGEAIKTTTGYKFKETQVTPQQKQQAQQLYSQYLDTIFPDSKVKDILLHGSPETNLQTPNASFKRGFYATAYEEMAKGAGGSTNWNKVSKIYRLILNAKNPRTELKPAAIADMERNPISYIKEQGYDSFIINNQSFKNNRPNEEVVVFEPEQIHILGSKQDIRGFKEFVGNTDNNIDEAIDLLPDSGIGPIKSIKPKFQALIDRYIEKKTLYNKSKRRLEIKEANAKTPEEKIEYRKRIQALERSIEEIEGVPGDIDNIGIINKILKLNALEDITEYATSQLDEVEQLIKNRNISGEELNYIRQVVSLWIKAGDFSEEENLFWDKEELERVDKNEVLQKVKLKFNEFRNRAENINTRFLLPKDEQLVREAAINELENLDEDFDLNKSTKDVNWFTMQTLDISEINDPVLQLQSSLLRQSTFYAHQEAIVIEDKVDELLNKINKVDWDLFKQTFSNTDKRETGNLVHPFSQEYWDTLTLLFNKARNSSKGYKNTAYKEAFDFISKNSLILDVRKLFPDAGLWGVEYSKETNEAHIEELKRTLGEYLYEENYEKAKKLVEEYKLALQAQRELIESQYENPAEIESIMQVWEYNNSPAMEAKIIEEGYPTTKVGDTFVRPSAKYSVKVPRRYIDGKETGFYDKKFDRISADENLREFYKYIFNKLNELKRYLPEDKTDWMQVNSLPTMFNTILESYSKDGLHAGLSPLIDRLKEYTRTGDLGTIDTQLRNPLTGEIDKKLQVSLLTDYSQIIKDEVNRKIIEYKQLNNKDATPEEILEFKKDAANELSKLKTFDLGKLIKAYSLMALTYKHKSEVQDIMEASNRIINRKYEDIENALGKSLTDKYGNKRVKKGLSKIKQMEETFMDVYYGYKMDKPFGESSKKIYTEREKIMKERLESILSTNEEKHTNNEIDDDEYERIKDIITDQLNVLGGVRVWSKFGDIILQYTQLKGMGWNVFAGITNMLYGFIANVTEASDGRNYTMEEFWKALAMVLNTIGGVNKFSPTAKKIKNIMRNLDALKVSRYELYNATTPGTVGKIAKKLDVLNPYKPQTSTEYINQGTVLVAMLLHEKVMLNGEEISMYDAYDENGKLKEGVEFLNNSNEVKAKIKIDKVIKMNHGNYDPDSPINAKRELLGRALSQFRTWAYQGFAERFMGEMPDYQLGIVRKGRYRSMASYYKTQSANDVGAFGSTFFLVKQLLRKATFGKYNTQFDEIQGLSEVDAANMRKNMTEITALIMITIVALLLKGMIDDDDNPKLKYISFFWINQLTRLGIDMSFYVSPMQFEKLTRNAMPAFTTVIDTQKALIYTWKYVKDNESDVLKSGPNKGQSKAFRAWRRVIPNPFNAVTRMEAASQQLIYNKPTN